MNTRAAVTVRHVYGLPKIYPANEVAHRLADLIGVKTFNLSQLEQIRALGFTVEQATDLHAGVGFVEAPAQAVRGARVFGRVQS